MRKKLIPVEQVPEVAQERIGELATSGKFDFTPFTLGAWSPSKYKVLDKCPLKFLLDYILKLSVIEGDDRDDDAFLKHIGTAAHTILELAVEGMPVEDAYKQAHDQHYSEVTEDHWHRVESLKYNIQEFLVRFRAFQARNPVDTVYTELKLAVDKDWNPVDFMSDDAFFRGVVDLPVLLQNNDAVILDHKHGGNPDFGLRNYRDQLESYKALFYFGYRKVDGIAGGIHFIKEGGILIGDRVDSGYIERIPNRITVFIQGAVEYVREKGKFVYSRNNLCNYCDYQPICHGGKRGTANLLEPVIELSQELLK